MSLLWLRFALGCYFISLIYAFVALTRTSDLFSRIALHAASLGMVFHFVSLVELFLSGQIVWASVHNGESLLAFFSMTFFMVIYAIYHTTSPGVVVFPIVFFLTFVAAVDEQPVLLTQFVSHKGWLVAHIILIFTGYAALVLSFGASLLYLVQERRLKAKKASSLISFLPALEVIDQIGYRSLLLGFPFMTLGLLTGCVVAVTTYGQVDFLDPKILLSVLMWAVYMIMVFTRWNSGWRGRRAAVLATFAFCRRPCGLGGELFLHHPQVWRLMRYQLIGVNHKSAPLEVRERLAIPESRLPDTCRELAAYPGIEEAMVISTCNRVEIVTHTTNGAADLRGFLHDHFHLTADELDAHLYEFREKDAVRHVFRVASSLDSMVVGEAQILGQVKEAYATARAVGAVRGQLDQLFSRAFAVAKRVRSETAVGSSSVSIASVAVELAKKIFGSLEGKTVFIVGAGKMSELAARHLMAHGCASIFVSNRTYDRAVGLAQKFNGQAIKFDDLYATCDRADIVITSTGAPHAIFRREHGEQFLARRKNRPMFFIDIAVPRDVSPEMGKLDGIFTYDIDDLQQAVYEPRCRPPQGGRTRRGHHYQRGGEFRSPLAHARRGADHRVVAGSSGNHPAGGNRPRAGKAGPHDAGAGDRRRGPDPRHHQ